MAVSKKNTSIGLVLLMVVSLFSALLAAPSAAAIEQVDLAIVSGQSPVADRNYPAFDAIQFSAEVENQALSPQTSTRTMNWFVCEGMKSATQCTSNDVASGQINVNGLLSGGAGNFSDSSLWYPSGTVSYTHLRAHET